ncbi:MAG: UDP-N-acetylmuramoyl-L-alanine--D-glutamate ligase [Xanthomonadales bacterium]|nr:UDP-N-acetylmuramoyl-L-alanine--D-glutamate ligase [Xanthomonadales bacterium]
MRFSELKNSRVAILGVGREGQAVWRQIRRRYPHKPLVLFSESAVCEELRHQFDPAVDELHVGLLDVEHLGKFDLLIRSAGISTYRDELVWLRSRGVRFTTASNLWFAENPKAKTICITGSLGKSTTAKLIAHLLSHAGVRVCLAGNIGKPMLDCEDEAVDWWVIELSSYQISDLEAKPDIAVLLNISEEHLDWHRGIERYKADKLRLAQLAPGGRLIANYADEVLRHRLKNIPDICWFNKPGNWQAGATSVFHQPGKSGLSASRQEKVVAPASLPGEHNAQNIAAALTVIDTLGLDIPRLDEALSAFCGLPHRLQLIGERAGVSYVDDSISTTPVSVAAALQTVGHQGVVLLLGGMDRGLDWNGFARSLSDHAPHAIIALPDSGPKILDCLKAAGVELSGGLHTAPGLKEAVVIAKKLVPANGCVLLSPGAPSYPHFRDYEDRGQQFKVYSGF